MRKSFSLLTLLTAMMPLGAWAQPAAGQTSGTDALQPGDLLQIIVWGQEAYSGRFKVDETGIIQYPVIGEIDVRNKTLRQIRDELRAGLADIFNRPFVTVTPQFNIAVLGHVQQPGLFTVDPTLTVLDIVAMAGGPSTDGNLNGIRLMRGGETTSLGLQSSGVGARSLQDVGLRSGDQIMVPRRLFTSGDLRTVMLLVQIALSIAILLR